MLTQLKQFYYFYETEVAEVADIKRKDVDDDTDTVRDTSLAYAAYAEID
jgi:hypothetical protein